MQTRRIEPIPITDPADERLADYRSLRADRVRDTERSARAAGVFIAEGEFVVGQLLESRFPTRSVVCTPPRFERLRPVLEAAPGEFPVYAVPEPVLERLAGFQFHRGVLAAGARLPEPAPATLLAGAGMVVVLEDVANHDNVGGMFRSVGALEPRAAVMLNPRCCDPLYRKAVRVSMGQVLRVPWTTLTPWPDALREVCEAGFPVLALTPRAGARDLRTLPPGRYALLVGAEGPGLSPEAFGACDEEVRIPVHPRADSLNVVVALSIALHHLRPEPLVGPAPGGS